MAPWRRLGWWIFESLVACQRSSKPRSPKFCGADRAEGETTVLVKDARDSRLVSSFQQEFPCVIEVNAENGINRLTEPNQVMEPSAGVYFLRYYVVTTNYLRPFWACVGQGLGL